jgi:LPXTG-site transpeptidase (sortase) family protein
MPAISLRKINNVLLVVVIAVNLYVISVPFLPQVLFHFQQNQGKQQALEDSLKKPKAPTTTSSTSASAPTPAPASQPNHVVIPSMLLDQKIVEDTNVYRALDKGVWRWPGGSTPDKGGNTVLVGHRFTYTKPKGVFYFMDKVHQYDTVGVIWDNKTYIYRVTGTQVVPPTQTSILDPTEESTLTMYTCTPLWLPKNRLVVTAVLESIQ